MQEMQTQNFSETTYSFFYCVVDNISITTSMDVELGLSLLSKELRLSV
jgi:hypothetical protein